ncbi:MAG: hypothetical protein Q4F95_09805 [Oscillospiraceae bacterium]|nr:hypothetical protein [Oscillospiraceae bacterium]
MISHGFGTLPDNLSGEGTGEIIKDYIARKRIILSEIGRIYLIK